MREYRLAWAEHLEMPDQGEVGCSQPSTVSPAADRDASLEHTYSGMVALGFRTSLGWKLEFVVLERVEDILPVGSEAVEKDYAVSTGSNLERGFGLVGEQGFVAVVAGHDVWAAVGSPDKDKAVEMEEGVAAVGNSCSRT